MKPSILRSQAGFGLVQSMIVLLVFAGLILYMQSTISNSQKLVKGLLTSDELDAVMSEITLALRDFTYCGTSIVPAQFNPGSTTPMEVSIRYATTGKMIATSDPTLQKALGLVSLNLQHVAIVTGVRGPTSLLGSVGLPGEGNFLAEIQVTANSKGEAFGVPLFRTIPIYLKATGSSFTSCFVTTYVPAGAPLPAGAPSKLTIEDKACWLTWAGAGPPPPTLHFDPWPLDPPTAASTYCTP